MNKYANKLDRYLSTNENFFYTPLRQWIQNARFIIYAALFRNFFKLGADFRPERPGLEAKYACEAAEEVGAQIQFLGAEFNFKTQKRIAHETRMNAVAYLARRFQWRES